MDKKEIMSLLAPVNNLIEHQKEMEVAKGENFNLFSILNMERLENRTHSNFLVALLNPKGSHLKGETFLKLFLETIQLSNFIDVNSAHVQVEHSCGPVNLEAVTGGRIDIFIQDADGNSISIENKIDANDQPKQIERYCNYNKGKNKVFYLTLDGSVATDGSAGSLVSGADYQLISYEETIKDWLLLCQKEAVDHAILRENIRQYILLIQKITNTMEKKYEDQLIKLLLANYKSAKYISTNLNAALTELFEDFRTEVIKSLNHKLLDFNYVAIKGVDVKASNAQIWIKHNDKLDSNTFFGIEPFGLNATYPIFMGIFSIEDTGIYNRTDVDKNSRWWSNIENIQPYDGTVIHFGEEQLISKIGSDQSFRADLIAHIAVEFMNYFKVQKPIVEDFLSHQL